MAERRRKMALCGSSPSATSGRWAESVEAQFPGGTNGEEGPSWNDADFICGTHVPHLLSLGSDI